MNPQRGEYRLTLAGQEVTGRLTLDLLARLQTALGVQTLSELTRRLIDPSADDTALFIATMSAGAVTQEEVRDWPLMDAMNAMQQVGAVFNDAFAAPEGEKSKGKPQTSRSRGASGSA